MYDVVPELLSLVDLCRSEGGLCECCVHVQEGHFIAGVVEMEGSSIIALSEAMGSPNSGKQVTEASIFRRPDIEQHKLVVPCPAAPALWAVQDERIFRTEL